MRKRSFPLILHLFSLVRPDLSFGYRLGRDSPVACPWGMLPMPECAEANSVLAKEVLGLGHCARKIAFAIYVFILAISSIGG